jgi:hypothetical protein
MPMDPSRRHFLGRALTLSLAAPFSSWRLATLASMNEAPSVSPGALPTRDEDALEEALLRLAGTGPEYGGGLANHGPMAADALVSVGRPHAVAPWVDRYKRRLQAHPGAADRIPSAEWRESLGRFDRVGGWIALFDRVLADAAWPQVLDIWATRLAPGLSAAAMHGVIRTGHATRALSARETPVRRHEMAEGLAYWAARYERLPERSDGSPGRLLPSEAIGKVPLLESGARLRSGSIMDSIRTLDGLGGFEGVADLVDASRDTSAFLADLTATFAGVYLDRRGSGATINLIHAVTGPGAIRLIVPHVGAASRATLLRYGWQTAAGIHAALGSVTSGRAVTPDESSSGSREDLVDRAIATGDEHAIKFTECCLREYALNPRPVYLHAAHDAVTRLG